MYLGGALSDSSTDPILPAVALETSLVGESSKHVTAGAPLWTTIYALRDPITLEIRYIGKTDQPKVRLRKHVMTGRWERTHKGNWIRSLLAQGLRPLFEVIDTVAQSEWQAAECAYVLFYKEEGCNLVNSTPGGEGLGAGENHPMFGKPQPDEVRAKRSVSMNGKNKGKYPSALARARMSAAQKAREVPPYFGKKHSDATRAKMSATRKGRKQSEEHRAKRGVARKAAWARWRAKKGA